MDVEAFVELGGGDDAVVAEMGLHLHWGLHQERDWDRLEICDKLGMNGAVQARSVNKNDGKGDHTVAS